MPPQAEQSPSDKRPLAPALFRLAKAWEVFRGRDIDPGAWFGPDKPHEPAAPEVKGRQYDYPPAYNIRIQPKDEGVSFAQLRALADNCTILRGAIETRKDQIASLEWSIQKRGSKKLDKPDARAVALQEFLQYPDRENDYDTWIRIILEDMFVLDQPCLYIRRTKGGDIYALEPIDGATIKPILSDDGRRPSPPNPAFQQILKGIPAADYTSDELYVKPRNVRSNQIYGYSMVEQLIVIVNMAIRRDLHKLEYYTQGSIPDALVGVDKDLTQDQVDAIDRNFQSMMTSTAERRKVHFVPGATVSNVVMFKDAILKDQFDEWLARVICWLFSLSPQALIAQMNRSTAEVAQSEEMQEGTLPLMNWTKRYMDYLIMRYFGMPDLEFAWTHGGATDEAKSAQTDTLLLSHGTITINELREKRGLPPIDGGEVAFITEGGAPMKVSDVPNLPPPHAAPDPNAIPEETEPESPPPPADDTPTSAQPEENKTEGTLVEKARRRVVKPGRNKAMASEREKMRDMLAAFFREAGKNTAKAIRGIYQAAKLAKAEEGKPPRTLTVEEMAAIDAALELDGWTVIVDATQESIERVAKGAVARTVAALGVEDQASILKANNRAIAYARERAAEMVGKKWVEGALVDNPNPRYAITETTRASIRKSVTKALEEGMTPDQLADEIEALNDFSAARAEMISHTELAKAQTDTDMELWKESGKVVGKKWLLSNDHEEDSDECDKNAAEGVIPLDQAFSSGDMMPPQHPNCKCSYAAVLEGEE